ncbi:FAD:protein FMN transferase [Rheinheimera texasensis]|uniref:FAD:protein FMN transferase n=1 Tax=Rheinheimera texasensis TaxID=306205 RepID=UPI0004E0CC69|nr:FAD:protein FMN transferase [Rheinheimera texasensis]
MSVQTALSFRLLPWVFTPFLLLSCTPADPLQHFSGPAQGSTYNITYWTDAQIKATDLQQQITNELDRIDVVMSNYRPDSVIEQFNSNKVSTAQQVGAELVALVEDARQVTQASQGCYDLTVKPLFELWGFKADKFNQPTPEQIAETMQVVGMDKISTSADLMTKVNPDARVDVSSIAQGYTVRQLALLLEKAGVTNYLVEVGGELQVRGKKPAGQPWKVAIEKPLPGDQRLQKIIEVQQDEPLAIMTSGTYRHYFDANGQRFSHVLDARHGAPVRHHTVSTTVLIDNATFGDAWSTAFLCLGSADGMKVADALGLKVLFIDQDGDQLLEKSSQALAQSKAVVLR